MKTVNEIIGEIHGLLEEQRFGIQDRVPAEVLFEYALRQRRIEALLAQIGNHTAQPYLSGGQRAQVN